ncbi:hypothetical protein BGW41_000854, partial [Actinomortierella wolfii]
MPVDVQPPVMVESPTSLQPDDDPWMQYFFPQNVVNFSASEPISMDDDSSDEDDDAEYRQQPALVWHYYGDPAIDVSPGTVPRLICHVQTQRVPNNGHEHRLEFRLLETISNCLGTVDASAWECSRQDFTPGGYAPQYPIAQVVAIKMCTNDIDLYGRTRVLVAIVYGTAHGNGDGDIEVDDDDSHLDHNTTFILDVWEAFDVVEVWISIPNAGASAEATWTNNNTSLPVSSFTSSEWMASSSHVDNVGTCENTCKHDNSAGCNDEDAPFSFSNANSNINNSFSYPFFDDTDPPYSPRRLLPPQNGVKISPCLEDGRKFRGRSARFVSIEGEDYLFMLGLLHGPHGNTSVQIYHLSRGLICSHQMGVFMEGVSFFPSHSGYDHLVVLLNGCGNCEIWDIFEGRPVLRLFRDMPRTLSLNYDIPPRFSSRKAGSRSRHLPCFGDTQWKNVSKDQYDRHGLRTWGIQVSRAIEGETPIPPTTSSGILDGGPFRVVTFSDAWESDSQKFQSLEEFDAGRGMWETRWWHLDGNDLGPPRALTRKDLMCPTHLSAETHGRAIRIPLPKWLGVERCWLQSPSEPPNVLCLPSLGQDHCSHDTVMNVIPSPPHELEVPSLRTLPRVFAHSRHCELLTAQPRYRNKRFVGGHWLSATTTTCRDVTGHRSGKCRCGSDTHEKELPLPGPRRICVATDDGWALSSSKFLIDRLYFEGVKRIRVKIMLVWHHYRIIATSKCGIYMVDMEEEQSQYGGQITVVQPQQVEDLVSLSLAGHSLVITRKYGIE